MQQLELQDDAGNTYLIQWRPDALSDPSTIQVIALDPEEAQLIRSAIREAAPETTDEEDAQDEPDMIIDITPTTDGNRIVGGKIRIPIEFEGIKQGVTKEKSFSLNRDNQADLNFQASGGTAKVSLSPCKRPAGKRCSASGSNGSVSSISDRKAWTISVTGVSGNSTVTISGDFAWVVR
jgi:hypothetical protein